ncbi:DUF2336 domain-containing protein [Hwanghaeella grinnelliae]|uniref:DUF2336 domain-containing protein n=1 Tax=Hwanghaeella grinnelliae TaxID=2500179 RepID=A0A3S2W7L9_9PROT|nr:DUF2336 domain-containing protein [Hwanghaeella grinnelliae]RVU34742.1 DUF2336 domain-containing protein [Hwanghaeella grinnelliae]
MAGNLNHDDVARLMSDPSPENRASTAEKVAQQFGDGTLSESEGKLAEEIFNIMVKDAEERVRVALAKNLQSAPNLPHDLASKLASDTSDSVALPIIRYSDVLTEDDLLEIVRTQPGARQVAVAERPAVSESVSEAIVEHGTEDAVVSLVSNEGAAISDTALERVVEKHGEIERVQKPLVHRERLPVSVAEKLVSKISDELKTYLVANHDLPEQMAADLILQTRERATIGLVSEGASEEDLVVLVKQMRDKGRLTPSIILRALCVGDMPFFETAISLLADVPISNARVLIHDEGDLGLRSLYDKAGLPRALYVAFRSAVDLNVGAEAERTDDDPEQLMRKMLERVLTVPDDEAEVYADADVEYLLAKFNKIEKRPGPAF